MHLCKFRRLVCLFCALLLVCVCSVGVIAADIKSNPPAEAKGVASFIKALFVPSDDYFMNKMTDLNDRLKAKLGGVAYLYHMLTNFFTSLRDSAPPSFNISLPHDYFYPGYRGATTDLFSMAKPYTRMLRDVANALLCVFTGIVCYHKLRTFFSEEK